MDGYGASVDHPHEELMEICTAGVDGPCKELVEVYTASVDSPCKELMKSVQLVWMVYVKAVRRKEWKNAPKKECGRLLIVEVSSPN